MAYRAEFHDTARHRMGRDHQLSLVWILGRRGIRGHAPDQLPDVEQLSRTLSDRPAVLAGGPGADGCHRRFAGSAKTPGLSDFREAIVRTRRVAPYHRGYRSDSHPDRRRNWDFAKSHA